MKYIILALIISVTSISNNYAKDLSDPNLSDAEVDKIMTKENKNYKIINNELKELIPKEVYNFVKEDCKINPKGLQEFCRFGRVYLIIRRVDFCKNKKDFKKCFTKQEFYFNKISSGSNIVSSKKNESCIKKHIVFPDGKNALKAYKLVQDNIQDSQIRKAVSDYYDFEKVYGCLYK